MLQNVLIAKSSSSGIQTYQQTYTRYGYSPKNAPTGDETRLRSPSQSDHELCRRHLDSIRSAINLLSRRVDLTSLNNWTRFMSASAVAWWRIFLLLTIRSISNAAVQECPDFGIGAFHGVPHPTKPNPTWKCAYPSSSIHSIIIIINSTAHMWEILGLAKRFQPYPNGMVYVCVRMCACS